MSSKPKFPSLTRYTDFSFAKQINATCQLTMIFNFSGIFASLVRYSRQSRLVGFVSRWLSFTLHSSVSMWYLIRGQQIEELYIPRCFFFSIVLHIQIWLRLTVIFSLLVSILAVPLTSKRFFCFLGISQLDSLVTASMASSSWPMKTQILHRSISLANKRNALLMPSFLSCSIDLPFAVTAAVFFFYWQNIVDSLETTDYVTDFKARI